MNQQIFLTQIAMALTLLLTCGAPGKMYGQQSVQYSQYMFNGLVINPAYAGAEGPLSLTFIQRSQWAGVEGAPSTETLSAHSLFKEKKMGLGLSIVNDRIGVHKNLNALAHYAYHVRIDHDTYLSMGIQAGVQNRRSDYLSVIGDLNNDPHLQNPLISHTSFDLGAGAYFRTKNFHVGVSVSEIIPQQLHVNDSLAIEIGNETYFLFSKYRLSISEVIDLEPSTLMKYLPGLPVSFDINVNVVFHEAITTGISYRKGESVDFLLKAQITPQLQFGYSYDHPINEITRISNGSHEMMVGYIFSFVRSRINSPR